MAEILLRVVERTDVPDPEDFKTFLRAGDVVSICPDGFNWGGAERTHPAYRIVRIDVLQSTLDALMARSIDQNVKRPRGWYIDVAELPDPGLFTGTRTVEIIDYSAVPRNRLLRAVKQKPPEV